ncbi:hypothetical protein BO99DRAFT_430428 [Aspergillus violaceofuscus CBS 115571]|uniref:Uncharacterized protein n=1 Tax=Aspergillus violaceofuscus (strain CBS 115571) TaxID=1450538 RepID=A0A2V5HJ10_ASPV1|nr:hypothetical protein BO99DRAFT_430428 [Aspergillus violaceofuscus CBS 115571]
MVDALTTCVTLTGTPGNADHGDRTLVHAQIELISVLCQWLWRQSPALGIEVYSSWVCSPTNDVYHRATDPTDTDAFLYPSDQQSCGPRLHKFKTPLYHATHYSRQAKAAQSVRAAVIG